MYALPKSNYLKRSLLVNGNKPNAKAVVLLESERIKRQLRDLGVSTVARLSMEGRYLPHIIHPDEHIKGLVYGKTDEGFAMLIATDKRAIYLDKKPLFVNEDEITYDIVAGVSYGHIGPGATVTLHTRIKDYTIQTINGKSVENFINAIETRCVEQRDQQGEHNGY